MLTICEKIDQASHGASAMYAQNLRIIYHFA